MKLISMKYAILLLLALFISGCSSSSEDFRSEEWIEENMIQKTPDEIEEEMNRMMNKNTFEDRSLLMDQSRYDEASGKIVPEKMER